MHKQVDNQNRKGWLPQAAFDSFDNLLSYPLLCSLLIKCYSLVMLWFAPHRMLRPGQLQSSTPLVTPLHFKYPFHCQLRRNTTAAVYCNVHV